MAPTPKKIVNGVDIGMFVAGRIDIHAKGILLDKADERLVWLAAMLYLKDRLYTAEQVVKKFSTIPGFNENATRTSINAWWDKLGDIKRLLE